MKKALIILLTPIVVLIILIITLPLWVPIDTLRQNIEAQASKASGMQVTIGSMHLTMQPLPGLEVTQIVIRDNPEAEPLARIENGHLSVAVAPLWEKRVEIQSIRFNQLDLRISRPVSAQPTRIIHVDSITGAVRLTQSTLELPEWQANLYGGDITLNARLDDLQEPEHRLTAQLVAEGLQMLPLLRDASGRQNLSGSFSSLLEISSHFSRSEQLRDNLHADGPVMLRKGSVSGIGMEGPAVALVHGRIGGSDIAYDALSFKLKVRGMNRWLNDIELQSSHLNADGAVAISANGALSGEINTSGTAGLTGATLMVGGTTENPRLFPAPSSLIGGTIGGTVAGPAGAAVGSKIGSSAGSMIEGAGNAMRGLFGK